MLKRRLRRKNYKFTEKTQSKRAITALGLGGVSLLILTVVVLNSFEQKGNGSMYLGSAGVTALLLAISAFVLAVKSLFEKEKYKLFPYLATFVSFIAAGIWISLYVAGFLFA